MLLSASRSRRRRIDILEPECAKAEFIDEMVDYPNWVCSGHVIVRAPLRLKDLRPSPTLNESLHDRRSYNLYDQKVRHSRALSHSFGRKLPLTFMDSARSLIFVILGLINHRLSEPIAPLSEKTLTEPIAMPSSSPLVLAELAASTRAAADAFIAAGTAANTVRSYQSALAYWSAWLQLRYRRALGDGPLPPEVAVQFIVDHLARPDDAGCWSHLLPADLDAALVAAGVKGKPGPLAFSTVSHRLAVLAKWHRLQQWENPAESQVVKTLLREARKAQARHGVSVRKKTAVALEPLQAMLATCTDGIRGLRDRALLLLAWSGGGRRRSEVIGLQVQDLRRLDADTWLYALGATKTDTGGERREKPLQGPAAHALQAWLEAAPAQTGPLFRRLYRGGGVSSTGLSGDQVARIVKRRAQLAGLEGDWAAHSLRSGFVTEAGRQGVPLGEVMAMTEHRSITTVMGYFQAGSLLGSRATKLLGQALTPQASASAPSDE